MFRPPGLIRFLPNSMPTRLETRMGAKVRIAIATASCAVTAALIGAWWLAERACCIRTFGSETTGRLQAGWFSCASIGGAEKEVSEKADTDAAPSTLVQPNLVAGTPLRIPYGNKDVAMKLGARYGSAGWYAPPGVDLSAFGERGWLPEAPPKSSNRPLNA